METTKPEDGSINSIVDNLIFEPQTNPEPEAEETVEATEDTQTEAVEDADVLVLMVELGQKDLKNEKLELRLAQIDTPLLVLVNKIDLTDQVAMEAAVQLWS